MNGLIKQWGKRKSVYAGETETFPIQFSTVIYVDASANAQISHEKKDRGIYDSLTNTNMKIAVLGGDNETTMTNLDVYWKVIGY